MDPLERYNDQLSTILAALEGRQAQIFTAIPGILLSGIDTTEETVSVQIAIEMPTVLPNGKTVNVVVTPLIHCPCIFPQGGGFSLTFPFKAGDECLVISSMRAIDAWWQTAKVSPPIEYRLHDVSDGFAILGCRSKPRVLSGYSTTTAQLRTDDGTTYVEVANGGVVNVVAPTSVNFTTPLLTVTGQIAAQGNVMAGSGSGDSVELQGHIHSGIQRGTSNTDAPVPGS
jgi:hypothetical protein